MNGTRAVTFQQSVADLTFGSLPQEPCRSTNWPGRARDGPTWNYYNLCAPGSYIRLIVHLALGYHRAAMWQLSVTERQSRSRLTRIKAQRGAEAKPDSPDTASRGTPSRARGPATRGSKRASSGQGARCGFEAGRAGSRRCGNARLVAHAPNDARLSLCRAIMRTSSTLTAALHASPCGVRVSSDDVGQAHLAVKSIRTISAPVRSLHQETTQTKRRVVSRVSL